MDAATRTFTDDLPFRDYIDKCDRICNAKFGVSIHDLSDYCWRDAFDDGETPARAVRRAVRADSGMDDD